VSLVQVTASSRWTTTVPKHSLDGIARIVPPLDASLQTQVLAPNRGVTGSTDQNNRVLRTAFPVSSEFHCPYHWYQQPNTLAYFLAGSMLAGHALASGTPHEKTVVASGVE
jgi:hypothetical protein